MNCLYNVLNERIFAFGLDLHLRTLACTTLAHTTTVFIVSVLYYKQFTQIEQQCTQIDDNMNKVLTIYAR